MTGSETWQLNLTFAVQPSKGMIYSTLLLFAAAWIGSGIALLTRSSSTKAFRLFLAFSGAFLFALAVLELLPRVYSGGPSGIGIWVLIGFLLQIFLEHLSGGMEHGHVQKDKSTGSGVPFGILLSLSLHAFLEATPIGHGHELLGDSFAIGLAAHKLPVSFALGTLLLRAGVPSVRFWSSLLFFSLMAPVGILIGYAAPRFFTELPDAFPYISLALVLGILLHVSTTILFESSEDHRFNSYKILAVLVGFAVAYLF